MGDNLTAVDLGEGRTALSVSAGTSHTCAVLDDTTLKCWGMGTDGQLGTGDTSDVGDGASEMGDNLTAVDLGTGRTAVSVSAGGHHTCAVLDDNTLKCWGKSDDGRLGTGDECETSDYDYDYDSYGDGSHQCNVGDEPDEMGDALAAVDLGAGRTAISVSAGDAQTCALLDDDTLKCWGWGTYGQLGTGGSSHVGDGAGEMGDALAAIDFGRACPP
jgi:alpha-tubulin suppressor-like RCC1 family protein